MGNSSSRTTGDYQQKDLPMVSSALIANYKVVPTKAPVTTLCRPVIGEKMVSCMCSEENENCFLVRIGQLGEEGQSRRGIREPSEDLTPRGLRPLRRSNAFILAQNNRISIPDFIEIQELQSYDANENLDVYNQVGDYFLFPEGGYLDENGNNWIDVYGNRWSVVDEQERYEQAQEEEDQNYGQVKVQGGVYLYPRFQLSQLVASGLADSGVDIKSFLSRGSQQDLAYLAAFAAICVERNSIFAYDNLVFIDPKIFELTEVVWKPHVQSIVRLQRQNFFRYIFDSFETDDENNFFQRDQLVLHKLQFEESYLLGVLKYLADNSAEEFLRPLFMYMSTFLVDGSTESTSLYEPGDPNNYELLKWFEEANIYQDTDPSKREIWRLLSKAIVVLLAYDNGELLPWGYELSMQFLVTCPTDDPTQASPDF